MKSSHIEQLKKRIAIFPNTSGVYLMKDVHGIVLYVGKAGQLRKRVQSYFSQRTDSPKIRVLRDKIHSIEYIHTPTEVEALLLEAHLINTYNPRYNTLLKDDKSYPLLKISGEEYPRISITRNKSDKKATYYGPYTDVTLLREAVTLLNEIFPIRKCKTLPKTACLYYFLGQCLAPCIKKANPAEYQRSIHDIESFLKGNKKSFIDYLTNRMKTAAAHYRFEEAQGCKNQIKALQALKKRKYSLADPGASISLSGSSELKKILRLKKMPERIICFDVSNIQGQWAVASKVSFFREIPDMTQYRRYKIRTIHTIDDYAMIREALTRMVQGIKKKTEVFKPDVIIIDGGKGHLHVAEEALRTEGYASIPCIAIAKQFETLHVGSISHPITLPDDSPALNVIKRIRDEAHRFAITYHRSLRSKALTISSLDNIRGIGTVRKKKLLQQFQTVEALSNASVEQIGMIKGFNKKAAESILQQLRGQIKK